MSDTQYQGSKNLPLTSHDASRFEETLEYESYQASSLQAQWEDSMSTLKPKAPYKHAAVLLLYWNKVGNSDMDCHEEVRQ